MLLVDRIVNRGRRSRRAFPVDERGALLATIDFLNGGGTSRRLRSHCSHFAESIFRRGPPRR